MKSLEIWRKRYLIQQCHIFLLIKKTVINFFFSIWTYTLQKKKKNFNIGKSQISRSSWNVCNAKATCEEYTASHTRETYAAFFFILHISFTFLRLMNSFLPFLLEVYLFSTRKYIRKKDEFVGLFVLRCM